MPKLKSQEKILRVQKMKMETIMMIKTLLHNLTMIMKLIKILTLMHLPLPLKKMKMINQEIMLRALTMKSMEVMIKTKEQIQMMRSTQTTLHP